MDSIFMEAFDLVSSIYFPIQTHEAKYVLHINTWCMQCFPKGSFLFFEFVFFCIRDAVLLTDEKCNSEKRNHFRWWIFPFRIRANRVKGTFICFPWLIIIQGGCIVFWILGRFRIVWPAMLCLQISMGFTLRLRTH